MAVVSIHAPAWGATRLRIARALVVCVSIHAPAWGATRYDHIRHSRRMGFNPRARVGRDVALPTTAVLSGYVSIHAPAWGATLEVAKAWAQCRVSIHAPAWGATL